ncbi:DNA repair protein [delta proteobacterium NaphS2]|nr:DNA repair protein [delta proteobacterium NaphS2]
MIEQRAGELIKAHPDRDPHVLQAGLDELRELQEVPMHYPVVEDLERFGNERLKRFKDESSSLKPLRQEGQRYHKKDLPEGKFGVLGDVGSGLIAGVLDAAEMPWRAARAFDPPGGTDIVRDIATGQVNWFQRQHKEHPKLLGPSQGTLESPVRKAIYGGFRAIVPSVSAIAAAGAVAATTPVGLPAALAIGPATLFGASQFDRYIEQAEKAGKTYEESVPYALASGAVEGGGEALANVIGAKIFGITGDLPLKNAMGPVKEMLTQRMGAFLGKFLKEMGVEVGTEVGQESGEALVAKMQGISDDDPLKAGMEAIGPAIVMTLLFGAGGSLYDAQNRKTITASLIDGDADPEIRRAAVDKIASALIKKDKGIGEQWKSMASAFVDEKRPIPIDVPTADLLAKRVPSDDAENAAVKPPVDQGMAAGTGEVDTLARTETTPKKAPGKTKAPEADAPMGSGAGEVDASAQALEAEKTPEPMTFDSFLDIEPEAPLPEQMPVSAQPFGESSPPVQNFVQPAERVETPSPSSDFERSGFEENVVSDRLMTVPTDSLTLDPDRFQYKRGMGMGGAGAKLRKLQKYDPELGGILAVWQDPADGKTYVVNGHHRFELAQRTGHPNVAVHVLQAKDAEAARTKGALINIAEGQGTPEDAAVIFRDAGITPESLESDHNISLRGDVAREGMALSRLDPGLFKRVQSGAMPRKWGVVIGENLPDPESQQELVKYLDKQQRAGKKMGAGTIGQLIEEVKGSPRKEEKQMGLFGVEAFSRPLLQERAEIRSYVIKRLAEDKRLFGAVANVRKAERLEAEGNVLDVEKNLDIAEKSAILKEAFEKLAAYGGPVSDMLNRAAEDYANASGKEKSHVKQEFFNRIRKEIPTLVRQGFGVVSERTPQYPGAEPSRFGAAETGEPGREPFSLTPDIGASQLNLFPGPEGRQGDLFKDAKEKIKFKPPQGQGAAALGSLRARQHIRMVNTGGSVKAASLHVDDIHAAASLLRSIRRQKQENLYAVTTAEDGKILEIHRVTKGTVSSTLAPTVSTMGRVFNTPGAHTVYLAHNHPSGEPRPSPQDENFTKEMRAAGVLKNIDVRSLVLGEKSWREILPENAAPIRQSIVRTPGLQEIPIKEGIVVREKSWQQRKPVSSSTVAKQILKEDYGNADGILLLDQQSKDIAFLPWPSGKPTREAAVETIAALEATNTNRMIINSGSRNVRDIQDGSRAAFIKDLIRALSGSIDVLDVIDRGESWADSGQIIALKPHYVEEYRKALERLNNARVLRSLGGAPAAGTGRGMYPDAVQDQVRELAKGFPGFRGRLVVLPSVKNLGERNLARAGIDPKTELVRGLHVTDSDGNRHIYLFSDALETPRTVPDILMEEMFHDGISTALGEDANDVLDRIYADHAEAVQDAVRLYGIDLETPEGRREAADEWLAKGMVSDTLPARVWQQIVAMVNAALRKANIAVQYSVSEIKALARKAVERTTASTEQATLRKAQNWKMKGVSPRKIWQETGWLWKNGGWTFKPGDSIRKSKAPVPNSTAVITGDREGKLADKRTLFQHFKEFWEPFSTLPEGDKALFARYKGMGTEARSLRYIEKIHKQLDAFPDDVKKDLFRYMDGQIDESTLPEEARTLGKALREKTTVIGQMLVDRGIISQKTFDAHKGQYVHYMYAAHILGDKVGGITTSTGKLNLSYAKQRKDLTVDERKALGLIEDASIAVPVGMGKSLIDIAKFDFLKTIANNDQWTWTPSIVEVPRFVKREGQSETVKMGIGKLVEEVEKYREMAEKAPSPEVNQQYEILQTALDKAMGETRNVPAEFTQLPTSKAYGPLAGAFVKTPIAKDIMPIMDLYSDRGKVFEMLAKIEAEGMALFKMGKVALNFPTAFRNVISNFIQNNMRGRAAALIPFDWIAAVRSMKAKDRFYEEAFRHGIFKTSWSVTEINNVLDEFRKAQSGNYFKILIAIKNLAKLYGKIDDINKHAIFLQMRRDGHSLEESVLEAMKWGMDYSLASRSVKHLRRHLVPFLSYNYKVAPLIAESLRKRFWVIGKYVLLLPMLAEALTKTLHDMDDDDWEELERQLPDYVKKSESTMILPWKTPEGHWQWLNAEYFFPWGNYHNLFRDISEGDAGEIYKSLGISNPFLGIARMVASARGDQPPQHPFYGTPIYNQLDPAPVKAAKTVEFLAFTWLPSMLSSRGALGYTAKAIEGEKDRWGKKVTPEQAFFRWFGFNVVAVSPSQTRAIASVKVQDLRKELYRIKNDPSISEERKVAAESRYRERLAEIARTGAQGAVLPIKKQKGPDPVHDELVRMLEAGEHLPGPLSRTFTLAGIRRKMTDEQFDFYLNRVNSLARPRLERLMTSPRWRQAPEKWRSERIDKIISNARKRARAEIRRQMMGGRRTQRIQSAQN